MSVEEKLKMSGAVGSLDAFDEKLADERKWWREFAPLERPELMNENNWERVRFAYFQALICMRRVERGKGAALKISEEGTGVRAAPMTPQMIEAMRKDRLCDPLIAA